MTYDYNRTRRIAETFGSLYTYGYRILQLRSTVTVYARNTVAPSGDCEYSWSDRILPHLFNSFSSCDDKKVVCIKSRKTPQSNNRADQCSGKMGVIYHFWAVDIRVLANGHAAGRCTGDLYKLRAIEPNASP